MNRFLLPTCAAVLLCGGLLATAPAPVRADDRSPEALLKEIDAVKMPVFDPSRRSDGAYIQQYTKEKADAMTRKAELIGALHHADPDNPRLTELLPERWEAMSRVGAGRPDPHEWTDELNDVIAKAKSDGLKKDAAYWKAQIACRTAPSDEAKMKAVDEFIAFAPKDTRGAGLLMRLAHHLRRSPEAQKALYQRIVDQYPVGNRAELARGNLRRLEAVGKPFDLEFTEATSGSSISMKALKGKVLVVDFWATWCGPCVAEMPKMKSLYAQYKTRGVEFLGVSLDQSGDGLDQLLAFVQENGITWPQYYQGNGWNSEFSKSWGINSIPAVFVVDQEGKIYSDKARGKLATILPELLKRSTSKTAVRSKGR